MIIEGKTVAELTPQTGEGKNGTWEKRGFVIETDDKYPKKIAIDVWDGELPLPNIGDKVSVSVNIESKEHNGRYFTNISAWKIDGSSESKGEGFPANEEPSIGADNEDEMPF